MKATYTYIADGTKASVKDSAGNGFDYLGSFVYVNDNNVRTFESTNFGGGRINATNNACDINYFITDHLGSTRVIVDANGTIKAQYNYYPFGKQWEDVNLMANTNRYTFSGKEKQTIRDLGWLDFMARMYSNSEIPIFTTQDPLSEKYYSISPYIYCGNNPLRYIDPFGLAYQPIADSTGTYTGFSWVDDSEAYDENGNLLDGYFEKAILFSDNGNWSLGTFQNGRYVSYNIGSSTAIVYDYEEVENEDGTTTKTPTSTEYAATTGPSDPSKFGTVAKNQLLQAVRHKHKGNYMALQMQTLSGSVDVPSAGINPNTKKNYVRGANIHKPGANNSTGTFLKNITTTKTFNFLGLKFSFPITSQRYSGISEGCFLIDITKWNEFISHFPAGVGKIGIINK